MRRRCLIFILVFLALAFLWRPFISANGAFIGSAAPDFKVTSADRKDLALGDIKGKVAVIFYEPKSAIEQNRKLKAALNIFYAKQPVSLKRDIVRVGAIDCRGVFFRGAWEDGLREYSLKEGVTVYGDWDGKMSADYHFAKEQSNIVVIDKKGIVRYYASGKAEDKDIGIIEKLLEGLAKED